MYICFHINVYNCFVENVGVRGVMSGKLENEQVVFKDLRLELNIEDMDVNIASDRGSSFIGKAKKIVKGARPIFVNLLF